MEIKVTQCLSYPEARKICDQQKAELRQPAHQNSLIRESTVSLRKVYFF